MSYHSDLTEGLARSGHRALLYSLGLNKSEFERPFVAVVSSWNEIVPGCVPQKEIAFAVKRGILENGGLPFEFCTIGVCDGLAQGHEGMSYSLPSREIIADSIEIMLKAHCFDGAVFLGSCDKITPGMLIAALRVNIPSIFVQTGPMWSGCYDNRTLTLPSVREYVGKYHAGKIGIEELAAVEKSALPTMGSCAMMGTANSMSCAVEAMGMSLPLSATTPPFFSEKISEAARAGMRIMNLIENGIKPRDIVNTASIKNVLRVGFASGASTNLVLHIQRIAQEIGLDISLQDMDVISTSTPYIAKISPSGDTPLGALHNAGGVPAIMKSLEAMLARDAMTVSGLTSGEIADKAVWRDKRIIRDTANPFAPSGGLKVLWGSLAPGGAVVKRSGVDPKMWKHRGPAVVFESLEEAVNAITLGEVTPGSVIVIRNEGPIGGPGMREMQIATTLLVGTGLAENTALVTDGRFSGASRGPCIGHISPEAAEGGPIGIVRKGDFIEIDLDKGILNLEISEQELQKRLENFKPRISDTKGALSTFIYKTKYGK